MIFLYGYLAAKYGEQHKIKVKSVREAIRALEANFPGFRNDIQLYGEYAVFRDDDNVSEQEVPIRTNKNSDWSFIPVPAGAKNAGIFQTILGVILIAVAFIPGMQWAAPYLIATGIGLIVGGLTTMFTPTPQEPGTEEAPEERPSYIFTGPNNKSQGGNPIALAFGEVFCSTNTISAGMRHEDLIQ